MEFVNELLEEQKELLEENLLCSEGEERLQDIKRLEEVVRALSILSEVGVSLPKVCTGCGRLSTDKIDKKYLACCPDNNYIQLRDYIKKSKYIEEQFPEVN